VARELESRIRLYGRPESLVQDYTATELTSRAILEWQTQTGIACTSIARANRNRSASSKGLAALLRPTEACATSA